MQASNLGSRSLTSVTMYALMLPSPVIPGRVEARDDNMHTCDPRLMFDGASIQKKVDQSIYRDIFIIIKHNLSIEKKKHDLIIYFHIISIRKKVPSTRPTHIATACLRFHSTSRGSRKLHRSHLTRAWNPPYRPTVHRTVRPVYPSREPDVSPRHLASTFSN